MFVHLSLYLIHFPLEAGNPDQNLGVVEFETQIPQTAVPGFQERNARIYVCGVFELEINQIYLKVLRQGTCYNIFLSSFLF